MAPTLTFTSRLHASVEQVWAHATSMSGVNRELRPLLRMTYPAHMETLSLESCRLGELAFTSVILAFGVLPVERWELTIVELDPGRRFVEESRVLSMKAWRHERIVEPLADGSQLTDRLTFAPRLPLTRLPLTAMILALFRHRHGYLRRVFG